ncbi:uncharacterized protein METZ01_LOCUS177308 [marine metagenome]|uniref:Amidohydrolase-related domain-containing protein n=1 Tax=marine metagenome TaxID=408172 RepID=A0A382CF10_9ZZZZ
MGLRKGHLNSEIEDILKGSFDLHVHASPDTTERRMDALETARSAYESKMSGFVLKAHDYPTSPLAYVLNRMYPGLEVVGAIALSRSVGGINPDAVRVSAELGAKVVWMPTITANHWNKAHGGGQGLRITDDRGKLLEKTIEVIEVVYEYEMVLASGHVSPKEVITLFKEAEARGVTRMIATHPQSDATEDEVVEIASSGAYLEYPFVSCMPSHGNMSPSELAKKIRLHGIERCIITTGLGQWVNPPPAEGMRMAIATMLNSGMSTDEISTLVKKNPRQLID